MAKIWPSTVLALALVGAAACEGGGSSEQLAPIAVNLPPAPSFEKEHAPEHYADGTVSVYGLRHALKQNLNKEVRVKGFLMEVYACPHEKCKGKDCPTCERPHFWLGDRMAAPKDKALLVVDYPKKDPETRKPTKLHSGIQYIVSGIFSRTSGTGFSATDGLVIYQAAAPVTTD